MNRVCLLAFLVAFGVWAGIWDGVLGVGVLIGMYLVG